MTIKTDRGFRVSALTVPGDLPFPVRRYFSEGSLCRVGDFLFTIDTNLAIIGNQSLSAPKTGVGIEAS